MFAEIGDDIMIVTFLSDARSNAKSFKNCALFRLCGKVGPPQSLASFENKDVAVRAWPGAAPRRSLTHQCFVNNNTRSLQREKVNAQFPLSYISDISHQD